MDLPWTVEWPVSRGTSSRRKVKAGFDNTCRESVHCQIRFFGSSSYCTLTSIVYEKLPCKTIKVNILRNKTFRILESFLYLSSMGKLYKIKSKSVAKQDFRIFKLPHLFICHLWENFLEKLTKRQSTMR